MLTKIQSHLTELGYEELEKGIWQLNDMRVIVGPREVAIQLLQDAARHKWITLLTKPIAQFAQDLP